MTTTGLKTDCQQLHFERLHHLDCSRKEQNELHRQTTHSHLSTTHLTLPQKVRKLHLVLLGGAFVSLGTIVAVSDLTA